MRHGKMHVGALAALVFVCGTAMTPARGASAYRLIAAQPDYEAILGTVVDVDLFLLEELSGGTASPRGRPARLSILRRC